MAPSKTLVRKVVYLNPDEAEAVRVTAFKQRRSESDLMREAIRKLLKIED
jgi:hypothetical protein